MSIWHELGIDQTTDERAIRRAYAARIKITRPDRDPAGFTRLRSAFEAALRSVAPAAQSNAGMVRRPETVSVEDISARIINADEAAIEACLSRAALGPGAMALADAIDRGALPLQAELELKDRLLKALIADRTLDGDTLDRAAGRLGWTEQAALADRRLQPLRARIAAENWVADLRRLAQSRRYRLGDEDAAAARLLTGGRDSLLWVSPPVPALRLMLGQLHLNARWIRHLFDSAAIERADALAKRRYPSRFGNALWVLAWIGATIGLMLATSLFFMIAVVSVPYLRISGFSRPGLFALAALSVTGLALGGILPSAFLAAEQDQSASMLSGIGVSFVVAAGIKQLFLPGKRRR